MGKKKPKEPENPLQEDTVSAPSDVFKSIFGEIPEQNLAGSIFSDSNPFKRKHRELAQAFGASVDGDEDGEPASVEKKKKKKRKVDEEQEQEPRKSSSENKKQKESEKESRKSKKGASEVGSGSDVDSETEKSKKLKLSSQAGGFANEDGKGDKSKLKEKEKGKKRKRDELERVYESKKYGEAEEEEANGQVGEKLVGKKRKKVDDPADAMASKEGYDDESKLLRTVFVGNLPLKIKKKALVKEFSKFGEVESARIRSVPILDTKIPRKGAILKKKINDAIDCVNAYVVFKKEESALASLAHNMAEVGGNHIRVDRACPPRKKLKGGTSPVYDNKRAVFVGNLPFDVKDEEIYRLFSNINNLGSCIEAVRVIRDPHTSVGKGIAYVLFKTRDSANLVAKKRNMKLRDRELRLSHVKPNLSPSKRIDHSPAADANHPAKKLAVDSSTPNGVNRANTKFSTSYQGLQASKGTPLKKFKSKGIGTVIPKKESMKKEPVAEGRWKKRPAVAARKARQNLRKEIGSSDQTARKRKMESRTPEISHQKNKKKFKKSH
ncbi:RNA-binding protein 34 [Rhodamnia argentea]|uniref:RNA-binding protein 34 n=1 Tax=Rhodamnia argentea TaxID=178133 RepID=A0A8B8NQR8_9MYRT|nr:RNA-binding protein 34 [Rhodamnia argentea]XP_030524852.1 RNA-binding protein 34 [Rhodamnia argentea]